MLGLIKDLKARYGISMKYARCDDAKENEILNVHANRKERVFSLSTSCQCSSTK